MAQKAGHPYRWALTLVATVAAAASCTEDPVQNDYVAARPGAKQPATGGDTVDEDEACDRIRTAEEDTRATLQCAELDRPPCPFYVRPAGSGCWEYSEDSVAACEGAIAAYTSCLDFDDQPCLLNAAPTSESCPAPPVGEGGAGGGGAPGTSGAPAGGAAGTDAGGASGGGVPGGAGGADAAGAGGA